MRKIDLDLVGTSAATTYRFRERGELPAWACCTVNDETGELTIQSDWGSWAHRWSSNPKHLGAPTLTHFLAGCHDVDYVARKLNREGKSEERFSAELTANVIKERLLEKRREDAAIYGADCHEHSGSPERHRHIKPLGRHAAREIWDQLDDLVADSGHTEVDGTLFFERMPHEIHKYLEELWDAWRGEIRPECVVLREAILPALFTACQTEIERRTRTVTPSVSECPRGGSDCPHGFCKACGWCKQCNAPCPACGGTGVIETGNNDLPCECPAGDAAKFNIAAHGGGLREVSGAELKAIRRGE